MIRLTELKLPLDHPDDALPALIAQTLGITRAELRSHTVYKRSYDARKQKLLLVYIADVEVAPTLVAARTALPPEGA
ncbi:MAG: FAD-dependent oxidoreductase, partial [Burkholderiales bacterium]